jgi:phosphoribosylamine--glycine ligase
MRILIVGGGGREHALAWSCRRERDDIEIICAPGNSGTSDIAENLIVDVTDARTIARIAVEREVDLVVIGPDAAVAAGVADACIAAGVAVFGPSAAAGRIESSKSFAKALMDGAGIPTARWMSGGSAEREALLAFVDDLGGACVVKADGLALGKGVVVCDTASEARMALRACFDESRFGAAGDRVVVEERLAGSEVSVLGLCDGRRLRVLTPARDYKRAFDGDAGPNTGGMGACAPPPDSGARHLAAEAAATVLQPCVDALRAQGTPFVGCLYAGLMVTSTGVHVLEFNARFGDPEAQVVLPLLGEPLAELLLDCAHGDVAAGTAAASETAVGVVAAAAGYPGEVRVGDRIDGLETLDADALCFHAGTRRVADGSLRTSGGRVLCVVARAARLDAARAAAYRNHDRIRFEGMQRRGDIAQAVGVTA